MADTCRQAPFLERLRTVHTIFGDLSLMTIFPDFSVLTRTLARRSLFVIVSPIDAAPTGSSRDSQCKVQPL